jgi:hypothetical protein
MGSDSEGHALLWTGGADSYVDLNPKGWVTSYATATANGLQVGYGYTAGLYRRALVWSGTADSYVDLDTFLPRGYSEGKAYGVDAVGNIVGTAIGLDGYTRAILWTPNRPR